MMDIFVDIERRMSIYDFYQKWRRRRRWIPVTFRPLAFRILAEKKVRKEIYGRGQ